MSDASALHGILRAAAGDRSVLCLAGGLPARESFPRHHFQNVAASDALGPDPLQYDWPEGRPLLREMIAKRMRRRGAEVSADDVVVTSGAQDALALALEAIGPGRVLVDPRTYPSALDLFRAHPRGAGPTLRYTMPALMNPEGRAMTANEHARALEADVLIEDDAYADLRFWNDAPPCLYASHPDKVFYAGSFSKTVSPGLRVGFIVPPRAALERVRAAKARRDLQACGVGQALVEGFMVKTDFEERLAKLRTLYRLRWERFGQELARVPGIRFREPEGGFSVWVETELGLDDETFLRHAVSCGVSVDPGILFMSNPTASTPLCVRLSFSAIEPSKMKESVRRFERAVASAPKRASKAA